MATTLQNNPFDQFGSNPFDQFDAPAVNPFDRFDEPEIGAVSNILRGAGERTAALGANLMGFAATTGQNLEKEYPMGGFVWEDSIIPEYKDPKELAEWQAKEGTTNILRAAQDELKGVDLGYVPRETWEGVKGSKGGWDLAKNVGGFALEQGLVSVPDMVAMVTTLPSYLMSRSEEIAQERAKNSGRTEPSPEDVAYGGAASLAVTALDRFGLQKMLAPFKGSGKALQKIGVATGTEATTEAIQEGIEYAAETVGTEKAPSTEELLDRMAAGAVGGGGFGGAVSTVGAGVGALRGEPLIEPPAEPTPERPQTAEEIIKGNWEQGRVVTSKPTEEERRADPERTTEEDRRQDIVERKRVADLGLEEAQKELLTSEVSGIPNRRAYDEAETLPVQASIDADSLKWINDNMSPESGDVMLKAIGEALAAETNQAFHISGDEFMVQDNNQENISGIMERVNTRLKDAEVYVERPDGEIIIKKGFEVTHGVGGTKNDADFALKQEKIRKEQAGQRAARGEKPAGVTQRRAEGVEDRQDRPTKITPEQLDGKMIKYQVMVEETGKPSTVEVDAGQEIRSIDARLKALDDLKGCV